MAYNKPDSWSQKAQKEGYPARSVYKLAEIAGKFGLFRPQGQKRILDLGAAPGSWSLYILRKFPAPLRNETPGVSGAAFPTLTASDLLPLSRRFDKGLFDREDFFFIQGDFTSDAVRETLFGSGPYGLLLSDAAPATTGNRSVDTERSLALAEEVLGYAGALESGGNLVVKVFQGGGTAGLLSRMGKLFAQAKSFKPKACRSGSFETYFIGLGKR
jgi:23S rRNA (uridine2552-2'-O)-methyltransferase